MPLAVSLISLMLWTTALAPPGFDKAAPFTAVRWAGDSPEVRVDGTWSGLQSIDGVSAEDIVDYAKKNHRSKWQKRIAEDLVELMSTMGHPPGDTVELALIDLDDGSVVKVKAPMTYENRVAAWKYNADQAGPRPPAPRSVTSLSSEDAVADLESLLATMEAQYSYFRLKGVDASAEIEAIKKRLSGTVSAQTFAMELTRFLARFGDGHSRLRVNPNDIFDRGYLPFLIGVSGDRFVAFQSDRDSLLDPKYPFVVAIDGKKIDEWMKVGQSVAPDASPQFKVERGARNLRFLQWARKELGVDTSNEVEVTLGAARGKKTKKVTLPVSDRKPTYGSWPRTNSGMMKGNIGYLRLTSMDSPEEAPALFEDVREKMESYRKTRGLVIDVRGNGGGTRHLLKTLLPYFLDPKKGPRVVNVAAKRLERGDDPSDQRGLLGSTRGLFPAGSRNHDKAERKAVADFAKRFKPSWKLPKGEFSDWHYMVISPTDEEGTYFYDKPVAVLVDPSCYSATDVFTAGFRGVPNVTLVGTPTGGGSGRSRPVRLPNSGIELQLSSMASFQWDGSLFDGVGVQPDVIVETAPTDFIGETDTVLDAAVKVLKKPSR